MYPNEFLESNLHIIIPIMINSSPLLTYCPYHIRLNSHDTRTHTYTFCTPCKSDVKIFLKHERNQTYQNIG